ncbi:MAG TPA: hypothetical protein PK859_03320 [Spirochaetota bacterium]|nr:hypothetical protein [Spirochaetota bacterium]HPR47777.1 hypothetical protein [Spirochaetota bacterium]
MSYCHDAELNNVVSEIISSIPNYILNAVPYKPHAIILTGSFSRGEGSIYASNNMITVLGDIEFLVYYQTRIINIKTMLHRLAKKISDDLRKQKINCVIDLGYISDAFFKRARSTIFTIELAESGKVIWGAGDVLTRRLSIINKHNIEKFEGFNLLCNRIIEQLKFVNAIAEGKRLIEQAAYETIKLYIDIPTIILAVAGDFTVGYHKRFKKLQNELYSVGLEIFNYDKVYWDGLMRDISFWINYKISPVPLDEIYAKKYSKGKNFSFVDQVVTLWLSLVPIIKNILHWQLVALGIPDVSLIEQSNILLYRQKRVVIIKDWIKFIYVLYNNRIRIRIKWKYFLHISPRMLIYAGALKLYFMSYNCIKYNKEPDIDSLYSIDGLLPSDLPLYNENNKFIDLNMSMISEKIYFIWKLYIK